MAGGPPQWGKSCVVQLLDSFEHVGPNGRHVCMAFEVLGDNLLALIRRYDYQGLPLPVVRAVTRQLLVSPSERARGRESSLEAGTKREERQPRCAALRPPLRSLLPLSASPPLCP